MALGLQLLMGRDALSTPRPRQRRRMIRRLRQHELELRRKQHRRQPRHTIDAVSELGGPADREQSRCSVRARPSVAVAAIACLALLAGASGAQAAPVTIGSNLSATPENAQNCGPCTEGLTALSSAQITAPCTGTVIGWSVRGFSESGTGEVKLRVLNPNGSGAYAGAGTSSPITLNSTDEAHHASSSLPISAGDFIGVDVPTNLTFVLADSTSATESVWEHPLPEGGSPTAPSFSGSSEVLINAEIACASTSTLSLSVSKMGTGAGTVTSSDEAINCGVTCSHVYTSGIAVTLTAAPASGSTFTGWSGACTGTGTCQLTMTANESVVATFSGIPPPNPEIIPPPDTKITNSKISAKQSSASFRFVAIGSATGFQCALIKAPKPHRHSSNPSFAECHSPKNYAHLPPGHYTFLVRAFNTAGADLTPASKKFTIHG